MSVRANNWTSFPSFSNSLFIFNAKTLDNCPSFSPTITPKVFASAAL